MRLIRDVLMQTHLEQTHYLIVCSMLGMRSSWEPKCNIKIPVDV